MFGKYTKEYKGDLKQALYTSPGKNKSKEIKRTFNMLIITFLSFFLNVHT